MQIDQDLIAALYVLGFNFLGGDLFSGEIAEIKGDMTIKLVHPPDEELKFVVDLHGHDLPYRGQPPRLKALMNRKEH